MKINGKKACLALLELFPLTMSESKPLHPIRRIREALKNTPEDLGLRKYGSAAGFAGLVGRSPSLVRNVESGFTPKWGALAELVERKIKVSREWMLSEPGEKDPIRHVMGGLWDPRKHLDPLAAKDKMPDWREVMRLQPAAIPRIMADIVHGALVWDLSIGSDHELRQVVSRFIQGGHYHHPGMQELIECQSKEIARSVTERLWESRSEGQISREELELRMGINLDAISIQEAERILEEHGMGWIERLDRVPEHGPISKFSQFYRIKNDPELLEYGDVIGASNGIDPSALVDLTNALGSEDLSLNIPPLLRAEGISKPLGSE